MSRPVAHGWAIQAPAWASPPYWLNQETHRTRAEAIASWLAPFARFGAPTWKQRYRKGWRCVRVTVVAGSPMTADETRRAQVQAFRCKNQRLMQQAIDAYEGAEEGTAAKAYAGGQVRAFQQVEAFLLRAT